MSVLALLTASRTEYFNLQTAELKSSLNLLGIRVPLPISSTPASRLLDEGILGSSAANPLDKVWLCVGHATLIRKLQGQPQGTYLAWGNVYTANGIAESYQRCGVSNQEAALGIRKVLRATANREITTLFIEPDAMEVVSVEGESIWRAERADGRGP
jgi:hypothetical protein